MTKDRPSSVAPKVHKVASLLKTSHVAPTGLPPDESAIAAISSMSDAFDIRSADGQTVFRAALSIPVGTLNGRARH